MNFLATPLGWLMKLCYSIVNNYGIALFIFTAITRLITLPFNIKQQKSTARTALIQPELEKIKKKYAKNQEKIQEETMKIYSKHGVNPMASCLPMLIPMIILFSMIPVVYGPLTYVTDLSKEEVTENNNLISNIYVLSTEISSKDTTITKMLEKYEKDGVVDVYAEFEKTISNEEKYPKTVKAIDSETEMEDIIEAIKKHSDIDEFITNPKYISQDLVKSRPELVVFDFVDENKNDAKYADILLENVRKEAEDFNYECFGISLGAIPSLKSSLAVIPFLSFILQLATTIVSQKFQKKNNPAMASMGASMTIMMYFFPLFSLYIGFKYPAGLGLYWIYSSLFALIQSIFLNLVYNPQRVQKLVQKDIEKEKSKKKKKKPSFYEKALEAQKQMNGDNSTQSSDDDAEDEDSEEEIDESKLSKTELKELQRKKINEARRRMAEKYGEEYDESEDID